MWSDYGSVFQETSSDIWKVLIDKAEAEAHDNIKTIPHGEGFKGYGVLFRWFTDVSGFGSVEQARRVRPPDPPKKGGVGRACRDVARQTQET